VTPQELATALAASVDDKLATQLVEEAVSLEEAFILRRWKYTELDGGRFAEVAARIVYAADSGNLSRTKSVDDCLKYVDNQQVTHHFPEPQAAVHLAKVIRAIYKLRSQRGAVHVSPTYTANEIDSRLIVEAARWVLADILRIFVQSNRDEVAAIIRALARFPQPLIRVYDGLPLLQSVSFTAEEEVLAHLLNSNDGLTTAELVAAIPKDQSGTRRAAKKLSGPQFRQTALRSGRWIITDLGVNRIEDRITREFAATRRG
jgi:hypothetical protein